ncbi:hypothetical protein [Salipiger abyssi]|uniref:hypothetical protein n=1 Tax=Salipiger abyssi TaxID=1250539 RepID=UPI001A8CBB45|nr:hypothetical protein [Salipiger abyssi]MBN9889351.1 hypothetical protein [Salipiger abyssi]
MAMRISAPFGGAVTQAFDIWSNWFENVGQIGFINIDLGRTAKPELERRILDDVGSYGYQIGRMSEALDVLIDQADLDCTKLSYAQIAALHDFREMVEEVKRCKQS